MTEILTQLKAFRLAFFAFALAALLFQFIGFQGTAIVFLVIISIHAHAQSRVLEALLTITIALEGARK